MQDRSVDAAIRFENILKKIEDVDLKVDLQVTVNDLMSEGEALWKTLFWHKMKRMECQKR